MVRVVGDVGIVGGGENPYHTYPPYSPYFLYPIIKTKKQWHH